MVAGRLQAGLPHHQRLPGSHHAAAPLHWRAVPQGAGVPLPQGEAFAAFIGSSTWSQMKTHKGAGGREDGRGEFSLLQNQTPNALIKTLTTSWRRPMVLLGVSHSCSPPATL